MNKDALPLHLSIDIPKESPAPLLDLCRKLAEPLLLLLSQRRLTTKERQILGGTLFRGSIDFVEKVRSALEADPALFSHLPIPASALKQGQDWALDLLFVGQLLQQLQRLVQDAYLQAQNDVVKKALQILEEQGLRGRLAFVTEEEAFQEKCRSLQLSPAQDLLTNRKGAKGKKGHKGRNRKEGQKQPSQRLQPGKEERGGKNPQNKRT